MNAKTETQEENVEVIEEQTEGEPKPTDAKQVKAAEKKFTDADMASLRKSKDKELTRERETWTTEKETMQSTIEGQEEVIKDVLTLLQKDLEVDDDVMELLKDKTPAEQLKFLMKKVEKIGKRDIPRTPKGEGEGSKDLPFRRKQTV
jgi:hypothetical protein